MQKAVKEITKYKSITTATSMYMHFIVEIEKDVYECIAIEQNSVCLRSVYPQEHEKDNMMVPSEWERRVGKRFHWAQYSAPDNYQVGWWRAMCCTQCLLSLWNRHTAVQPELLRKTPALGRQLGSLYECSGITTWHIRLSGTQTPSSSDTAPPITITQILLRLLQF